jgi:hypothetical protein
MPNDESTDSLPDDDLPDDDLPDDDLPDDDLPDDDLPDDQDDGEALRIEAYDLNDDGTISPLEGLRADIGVVDARLEQLAEQPGITGRLADAAHHLLDHVDND